MKKGNAALFALSLCCIAAGVALHDRLHEASALLIVPGVALFLFALLRFCLSRAPRCPKCGAVIYRGHIRTIARQRDGLVPCEQCGTLVQIAQPRRRQGR